MSTHAKKAVIFDSLKDIILQDWCSNPKMWFWEKLLLDFIKIEIHFTYFSLLLAIQCEERKRHGVMSLTYLVNL